MKIQLTSIFVWDQQKALEFYTEKLGFVKKLDIPIGNGDRWLTVVSPEGPNEIELLLEPNGNTKAIIDWVPAARAYQEAIFKAGIPATAFRVDDIHKEFERLKSLWVSFVQEPVQAWPSVMAIFDDTCWNLIQIYQV